MMTAKNFIRMSVLIGIGCLFIPYLVDRLSPQYQVRQTKRIEEQRVKQVKRSEQAERVKQAKKQYEKLQAERLSQKAKVIRDQDLKEHPLEIKEDNLENRIDKKLGISNLIKGSRLNKILWLEDRNTLLILITVNDNLTKGLIEHGWWGDAWEVLQIAYDDPKVQSDVMVQGFFPITDPYGNTKWRTIGAILLPRNEYQKINRRDFIPKDLVRIGTGEFNTNGID